MHIFIDESGTFTGTTEGSISVVGALVVPDVFLWKFHSSYEKVRRGLPIEDGHVKGRRLNELQISKVAQVARKNLALFEATVIDGGHHTREGVLDYKHRLSEHLSDLLPKLNVDARARTQLAIDQLKRMPVQLFLQASATFSVLERVLNNAPLFFVQRFPKELGAFTWVIDGKNAQRATDWEQWWSWYAQGVLAVRSKLRPGQHLDGADYSHFTKFEVTDAATGAKGCDLGRVFADVRFLSGYEPGLEVVDILTNAVRRALSGRLQPSGWKQIPSIMIARHGHYLEIMHLEGAGLKPSNPGYADVFKSFDGGGRSMLAPSTYRRAQLEERED